MLSLLDIFSSFMLGLLTPLTAVCVLPLYPAFLAYLANQFSGEEETSRKTYAMFGVLIVFGVILFMLLLGLIFTTILKVSLTSVIRIVSPIAFGILIIISIALILNVDFSRFIPKPKTPSAKSPVVNALLYGFFFGAIVIPCSPAFISAFFARSLLFSNFFNTMLNFVFFGIGLGFPLLLFSLASSKWSQSIINFATRNKKKINIGSGIIMLVISLYYLIFVFRVFG